MRVAILQNCRHAKLRRFGKQALTAAYQAASAGQSDWLVLPDYDSFAGLLDRDPIMRRMGDAIDSFALRSAEIVIWEWGCPNGESPFSGRMRYGDFTHETNYTCQASRS